MNKSNQDKSTIKILKGSAVAYLSIGVHIVTGIVYTPWMARQIGQSNYGLYTLAISLVGILMFDFGIGTAISRFIARYNAANDLKGSREFMGMVYKIYILIDVVILFVSIIIFLFLGTIYGSLTPKELSKFKIIYIFVVGYNIVAFPFMPLNGVLNGNEEFAALKGCDLLTRVLNVILVIICLSMGLGLYALVLAYIVSGIAALAVKTYIVEHRLKFSVNWKAHTDWPLLKEVISFLLWAAIGGIATNFGPNLIPSILAAEKGARDVAIFGTANTLNGYAYLISSAIGGMFLPRITRIMQGENSRDKLSQLGVSIGRIMLMISSLILCGFICVGKEFFILWMGTEYASAYQCACLLLTGELSFNSICIFDTAMISEGYLKPVSILKLSCVAGMLCISLPLCRMQGSMGAAAAMMIAYLFRGACYFPLYKKYLKVDIFRFFKEVYSRMLPQYLILILVCWIALNEFDASNWMRFFLKSSLVLLAYLFYTVFFVLDSKEKEVLFDFINGFKKKRDG